MGADTELAPLTPAEIEAGLALCAAAWREFSALCAGKKWRMCIPVQPDDSDVVIGKVFALLPRALAQLQARGLTPGAVGG